MNDDAAVLPLAVHVASSQGSGVSALTIDVESEIEGAGFAAG